MNGAGLFVCSIDADPLLDQVIKFIPQFMMGMEASPQGCRPGFGSGFLDAAGSHTAMLAFNDYDHIIRACDHLHDVGNVCTKPFLKLQTLCSHIADPGDFGKTNDLFLWQVSYMNLHIIHQCHVMLAIRKDFNVLYHHKIAA